MKRSIGFVLDIGPERIATQGHPLQVGFSSRFPVVTVYPRKNNASVTRFSVSIAP